MKKVFVLILLFFSFLLISCSNKVTDNLVTKEPTTGEIPTNDDKTEEETKHICDFSERWNKNSTSHWHECACGEKSELAEHSWDNGEVLVEATEDSEGSILYTCTVCEKSKKELIAKLEHVHSYDKEWKYDENNHWKECVCGEESKKETHKGGTATTTTKAICSVCAQSYGELVEPAKLDIPLF